LSTGRENISVVPKTGVVEGAGAPAEGEVARPLRADAQRNRARILEAAESVFANEGIEAPVDVIAEKAGVGVGTLYRHFPNKERLCEAILLERLTALAADARALAGADNPAEALFGYLEHFVAVGCAKRDLIVVVSGSGLEFEATMSPLKEELREAIGVLLARAQAAGAVRPDVTADVVMTLTMATCQASAHQGAAPTADVLSVVFDGLRVQKT
jgi:AcrR family transcriptional regulator